MQLFIFVNMDARPVKIFSSADTPRLRFIAGLLLGEILGLSWEIVTDRRRLGKFPVINYSGKNLADSFTITPSAIMFEDDVHEQDLNISEWKGLPILFRSDGAADFPFDIFAASFYLVARYEEYLGFEPDDYGRFRSSDSVAVRHGFLDKPVVDLWVKELAKSLVRRFPSLTFRKNVFSAVVTFDIDEPFAFLGKDLIGNLEGFLHDFTSGSKNAGLRYDCLKGSQTDPFSEAFDYILNECARPDVAVKFFFPVGNHGEFDKNPSWKNRMYREMIKKTAGRFSTGLHPSYMAGHDLRWLKTETGRLNSITLRDCLISRFHYLRFLMPLSFRNLIENNISEDYSMGYSDEPGFRAGIARPFRFFDISGNRITDLRIFPFQVMDVMMKDNKKLSPEAASKVIGEMISQTKNVGGLFISIWHNTSFLDTRECREWRGVFKNMLNQQAV